MTVLELREKRNKAWEAAKAFVETKRDKDSLLSAEDAATYAEMEKRVQNYSAEIIRMEEMEAMEAELNKPVNTPITSKPVNGGKAPEKKTGRASDEYKDAMLHVAVKVTEELLYDNAFGLENYLLRQFSRALANAEEDAFLNGDGVGKPLGIFAEEGGGQIGVTAASATEITADEIINLVYALKLPYRKKVKFLLWMMRPLRHCVS